MRRLTRLVLTVGFSLSGCKQPAQVEVLGALDCRSPSINGCEDLDLSCVSAIDVRLYVELDGGLGELLAQQCLLIPDAGLRDACTLVGEASWVPLLSNVAPRAGRVVVAINAVSRVAAVHEPPSCNEDVAPLTTMLAGTSTPFLLNGTSQQVTLAYSDCNQCVAMCDPSSDSGCVACSRLFDGGCSANCAPDLMGVCRRCVAGAPGCSTQCSPQQCPMVFCPDGGPPLPARDGGSPDGGCCPFCP